MAVLVSLGGTLLWASIANGGATHITVEAGGSNKFDPEVIGTGVGPDNLQWDWDVDGTTDRRHNVVQDKKLFSSGKPTDHRNPFVRSVSAGTFRYHCARHGGPGGEGMSGKVIVEPGFDGAATDDTVPIRWAVGASTTGNQYDVRFRVGENGRWRTWKRNSAERRDVFGKNNDPVDYTETKKFYVQTRSEKSANPSHRSGWSSSFFFGDTPF